MVFLLLYVDYILISNLYEYELEELKRRLSSEFEMKGLGDGHIEGPSGWDTTFVSARILPEGG